MMHRTPAIVSAVAMSGTALGAPLTVVTHGFSSGDKGVWVQAMAEAMIARTGVGTVFRIDPPTGEWRYVAGSGLPDEPIVVIFNWTEDSDFNDNGEQGTGEGAGDALYAALRDPRWDAGLESLFAGVDPLADGAHFIGHSRGAIVISETIERLDAAGASVFPVQMTTLDAHPVNGTLDAPYDFDWGDPTPQAWSIVTWADNYYRADGGGIINGLDFDGIPITGAWNVMLSESALNAYGYGFAHLDVHLWYHGTIDLATNASDGEQAFNATMRNLWFGADLGAMDGYFFSDAVGGGPRDPSGSAPRVEPGAISSVYNGDFQLGAGQLAGWFGHGGSGGGHDWATEPGNIFLRLPGAGSTNARTHNRFFIDAGMGELRFRQRVVSASPNDRLRIALRDNSGATTVLLDESLPTTTAWIERVAPIPANARGRTHTLTIDRVVSDGALIVDIDDIGLAPGLPPCPADLTGDGVVDGADLATLLGAWGASGGPADLTDDGVVDGADLATLLGAWGVCP